ncbi:MAG: argininosuccinate lyase [Magnetococcales bacterium]|nr:argininosuccinate lyase [Magnetococcales bacterium]
MKHILAAGALFGSMLFAGNAMAEAKQDFDLTNKTGYTLTEVYVGPTKSDDWGDNILEGTMPDGSTLHMRFHRAATTCNWDLKVTYDDNSSAIWYDVDLCAISKIKIRWNKQTQETTAEAE